MTLETLSATQSGVECKHTSLKQSEYVDVEATCSPAENSPHLSNERSPTHTETSGSFASLDDDAWVDDNASSKAQCHEPELQSAIDALSSASTEPGVTYENTAVVDNTALVEWDMVEDTLPHCAAEELIASTNQSSASLDESVQNSEPKGPCGPRREFAPSAEGEVMSLSDGDSVVISCAYTTCDWKGPVAKYDAHIKDCPYHLALHEAPRQEDRQVEKPSQDIVVARLLPYVTSSEAQEARTVAYEASATRRRRGNRQRSKEEYETC